MSLKDLEPFVWNYKKKTKFQKWEETVNKLEDLIDQSMKSYQTVGKNMMDKKEKYGEEILKNLVKQINANQTHDIIIPGNNISRIIQAKFNALIQMTPCLSELNLSAANVKVFHPRLNKILNLLQRDNPNSEIPLQKVKYSFDLTILDKIYKRDKHNFNYSPEYLTLLGYLQSEENKYNKVVSLQKVSQPKDIKITITRKGVANVKEQDLAIEVKDNKQFEEKLCKNTDMILNRKEIKNNRKFTQKEKLKGSEDKRADLVFNMLVCTIQLGMVNSLASPITLDEYWDKFVFTEAEVLMRGLVIGNLYSLIKDIKTQDFKKYQQLNGKQEDVYDEIMDIFEGVFLIGCEQQLYLKAIAKKVSKIIEQKQADSGPKKQLTSSELARKIIAENWACE